MYLEQLRAIVGTPIAEKVKERGPEMSFVGYRNLGLLTNLGEVHSNRAEQHHSIDEVLRGLPVTASCLKTLHDYALQNAQRKEQIVKDITGAE